MRSFLVSFTAFVLVLSACSGSTGENVSTGASAADGPQSFDEIDFRSPIAEFLGFDFSNDDASQARIIEQQREEGRITAECMRDKGFNYTPQDPSTMIFFGSSSDLPYFSPEWVDKYGFGISTQRFEQEMVGDLVGYSAEDFGGPGDDYVDPNQEYLESLSEGENQAWQEALYGPPMEFGPEGPSEDFNFEPQGCQGEAYRQSSSQGNQQQFYETFGSQIESLYERTAADPRVVEFNDRVSSCVAESGLIWTGQDDLYEQFESRLSALQPDSFTSGDPFESAGLNPEEMSQREIDDFFRDLNRLSPESLSELATIQAEEIELARVVTDCGGGPLNEQVVVGEVRVEYEQDFLDNNAAEIAEYAAE